MRKDYVHLLTAVWIKNTKLYVTGVFIHPYTTKPKQTKNMCCDLPKNAVELGLVIKSE